MASNYNKLYEKQYDELMIKYEKQEKLLKEIKDTVRELNEIIKNQNVIISKLTEENDKLKQEILRMKAKNDKDSSNSSKPSSTNGSKKVITNRRVKSTNKQGGQLGHEPHSLNKEKLEKFINSGNVEHTIINVNKNKLNQNKKYISRIVLDIKIVKTYKEYRYYPDENGNYNIPKEHIQAIQYGNNIKAISTLLMNDLYNSTDGVARFISSITNEGITLSKGTLINWNQVLYKNLEPEIKNIERNLECSYYINHDEAQFKINGENYNILCACNNKYTRLWYHQSKSREALEQIGFLPNFFGVIVKDGTELYNPYGTCLSQCLSHILRYLVDFYTKIKHEAPKKLSDFLSEANNLRNKLINKGVNSFTTEEYNTLISTYISIIKEWEEEIKKDASTNYLYDEEKKLYNRMKYDNKKMNPDIRGDKDEILYFLKDFNVPSTNSQAEVDQRNIKIKQKIGKFRSEFGAEWYVTTRSCINTYKKNAVNTLEALKAAFNESPIIV